MKSNCCKADDDNWILKNGCPIVIINEANWYGAR